eukprot:scaffold2640_cov166-Ochromonas_danica.AAC.3
MMTPTTKKELLEIPPKNAAPPEFWFSLCENNDPIIKRKRRACYLSSDDDEEEEQPSSYIRPSPLLLLSQLTTLRVVLPSSPPPCVAVDNTLTTSSSPPQPSQQQPSIEQAVVDYDDEEQKNDLLLSYSLLSIQEDEEGGGSSSPALQPSQQAHVIPYITSSFRNEVLDLSIDDNSSTTTQEYYGNKRRTAVIRLIEDDRNCFNTSCHINDSAMLFGISHLLAAVPTTQQCRIHAFDPLFYTQIKRFTSPKRIHEEGKKWIKHVNIFSMDFVLFPLVYDGHWSLFILVRPYLLLRACASNIDEETDDQPCFISVDSLNSYHDHSKVHDRLQNFVLKELSLQDMSDEDALDKRRRTSSKIRLIKAKASRQTNSDDCGIFVLMYVQALLRDYPRSTKTELDSRFESTFTNLIGTAENFRSVAKHTIDE